jgi:hypothetical protein
MDVVKSILNSEIERINRAEGRDGKPRINSEFFINHPWLCLAMFVGYIAVGIVMYASPYMGLGWFAGFTVFNLYGGYAAAGNQAHLSLRRHWGIGFARLLQRRMVL